MLLVGLTGGIGSGKSAVAARLATLGAVVIDADRIAREVVEPGTAALAEIVEAFGPEAVDAAGRLDRAWLARRVFEDPTARRRLEAMIHPRVRARTAELAAAAPPDAVVVNEVPLLVEAGLQDGFDLVIVVRASIATRIRRLVEHRAMDEAQALARIDAQASDVQRAAVADIVIDNDGTPGELLERVDEIWRQRLVQAAAKRVS